MLKYLSNELREQRARLLARAAPLEADVGALLSATVDAVPPAAARARLRDLDERWRASCVSVMATSPSKSGLRDVLTRLTVITDGTDAT